jgi:hypothetical protein
VDAFLDIDVALAVHLLRFASERGFYLIGPKLQGGCRFSASAVWLDRK